MTVNINTRVLFVRFLLRYYVRLMTNTVNYENLDDLAVKLMQSLSRDHAERGSTAILDRCYDRQFCAVLGFNYGDKYLYSRIEQTLTLYNLDPLTRIE